MEPHLVTMLFWISLGGSVVCTLVGVLFRSWKLFFAAAALSLWCGIAAFFSIGLVILLLTGAQLGLAGLRLYKEERFWL